MILVFVDVFVDDENKKVNNIFFFLFHSYRGLKFWRQFINVIATDDNLLIDDVNFI